MKKVYGLLALMGVFFFAAGAWAPPGPKAIGADGKVGQVGEHRFSGLSAHGHRGAVGSGNSSGKPRS